MLRHAKRQLLAVRRVWLPVVVPAWEARHLHLRQPWGVVMEHVRVRAAQENHRRGAKQRIPAPRLLLLAHMHPLALKKRYQKVRYTLPIAVENTY